MVEDYHELSCMLFGPIASGSIVFKKIDHIPSCACARSIYMCMYTAIYAHRTFTGCHCRIQLANFILSMCVVAEPIRSYTSS